MRYLLDSHVFLWYDEGNEKLKPQFTELLDNPEHELYLSAASLWELAIKRTLGRLKRETSFSSSARRLGIQVLPVTSQHAEEIEQLPRLHGDPFDHMLVAQSRIEGLVLVTHDRQMQEYDVAVLRV
jgi:PIN domain nuclease of toxin-antitoxin system